MEILNEKTEISEQLSTNQNTIYLISIEWK